MFAAHCPVRVCTTKPVNRRCRRGNWIFIENDSQIDLLLIARERMWVTLDLPMSFVSTLC